MAKRFLTHLLGEAGYSLAALALLWVWMTLSGYAAGLVIEMILALALVRLLHSQIQRPRSVLYRIKHRRTAISAVAEEALMAISFSALCYLLQWPVKVSDVIGFLALNMLVQMAFAPFTNRWQRYLHESRNDRSGLTALREALVVGTGPQAMKAADMILDSTETDSAITGFLDYERQGMWSYRDIPLIGHPDEIEKIVAARQVDFVIVAVESRELPRTVSLLEAVERMGVTACVFSQVFVPSRAKVSAAYQGGRVVIEYVSAPTGGLSIRLKSVIDRLGALAGLMLSVPIMLLTAIAIKIDSPGPIFFRQTRSGVNGRPFKLWKFRTMEVDAEKKKAALRKMNEMSGPVFKISDDPRITRVGRFLRKYSIDELPQFLNVLLGEMSLVGPRPPLPSEVAEFEPWQHRKLSVKPGLTCLWQANGRNKIDFEDWMKMDLQYIDNWSLWEDTKIMAKTIPTVLRGSGK